MKKLTLSMSLLFAFSLMSYASTNEVNSISDSEVKTEITNADYTIQYEIIEYTFDTCSITVTVTTASGNSYSATAVNNQGNCHAAQAAALDAALTMAAFYE